jgi:hypothetical protein
MVVLVGGIFLQPNPPVASKMKLARIESKNFQLFFNA